MGLEGWEFKYQDQSVLKVKLPGKHLAQFECDCADYYSKASSIFVTF